jgi:hypothetical protein
MMTDAQLQELKPNWMIYDEYYRTGAEVWQKNVEKLLQIYPEVPVLGLTGTGIRYLDNQRDMGSNRQSG